MGRCEYCHEKKTRVSGRTFHRFPHKDLFLLDKWVEKCSTNNWRPSRDSVLCSAHFEESCFERTSFSVRLKKNSIPTIFGETTHCISCKSMKLSCKDRTFHKFPLKEPQLVLKWIENVKVKDLDVEQSVLCSMHFEKTCFRQIKGYLILKQGSVPTLFGPATRTSCDRREEVLSDSSVNEALITTNEQMQLNNIWRTPKRRKLCEHRSVGISGDGMNTDNMTSMVKDCDLLSVQTCQPMIGQLQTGSNRIAETESILVEPVKDANPSVNLVNNSHQASITETPGNGQSPAIVSTGKRKRLCDHDHNYFNSPKTLEKKLQKVRRALCVKQELVRVQKQHLKRMRKQITSLKNVVSDLRKRRLVSESALSCLESISDTGVKEFILRSVKNSNGKPSRMQYPPSLRSFALTLHFYSPKAYEFVRKKFNLALPHATVLRSWYSTINGEPGFTAESFDCLKQKVEDETQKNRKVLCALMLDEIGIKKGTQRSRDGTVRGHVDFGTELEPDDQLQEARDALVLMVVSLDGRWKIPIAYFLINGITADTSASLVTQALVKLHDIGVEVSSLTLDGPSEHFAMVKLLGANMCLPNPRPFFPHPSTKNPVHVVFDPCHMLKLIRNCLGDWKVLVDGQGRKIEWRYITSLAYLQEDEGLRAGNKLRLNHVRYLKMKMKVRLAAQTLSQSVASTIEFCWNELHLPQFEGCEATVEFLRSVDILFDFLNSRNPCANGFKAPLKRCNEHLWRPRINEKLNYLLQLKDLSGNLLYTTRRKTAFIGIYTAALSVMKMFDIYVKPDDSQLKYLSTYKFSQDHLELFFCAVRSSGGWCTNPTCSQFVSAYKRLLIRHEIAASNGNSSAMDSTKILTVSSGKRKACFISHDANLYNDMVNIRVCKKYDLEYTRDGGDDDLMDEFVKLHWKLPEKLSDFTINSISYVCGYVVRKLLRRLKCDHCRLALIFNPTEEELMNPPKHLQLTLRKNRGGLTLPSSTVMYIASETEKMFRHALNSNMGHPPVEPQFPKVLCSKVMQTLLAASSRKPLFDDLNSHIFDENPEELSNHLYQLTRSVISSYVDLRMFAQTKIISMRQTGENIRHHVGRQLIWAHQ